MTDTADLINASFEALGGLFILNHCWTLVRHKDVKGVSILSTCYFFMWGIWNLFYYPYLDQWLSFLGGACLVFTNFIYILLMVYYKIYPGGRE